MIPPNYIPLRSLIRHSYCYLVLFLIPHSSVHRRTKMLLAANKCGVYPVNVYTTTTPSARVWAPGHTSHKRTRYYFFRTKYGEGRLHPEQLILRTHAVSHNPALFRRSVDGSPPLKQPEGAQGASETVFRNGGHMTGAGASKHGGH